METPHIETLLTRVFVDGFVRDANDELVFLGHERVREPLLRDCFSLPSAEFLESTLASGGVTRQEAERMPESLLTLLLTARGIERPQAEVLAEEGLSPAIPAPRPFYRRATRLPLDANSTGWVVASSVIPYFVRFDGDNALVRAGVATGYADGTRTVKTVDRDEIAATLAKQREELAALNKELKPMRLARAAMGAFNAEYGLFATIHEQECTSGLYLIVNEEPRTLVDIALETFAGNEVHIERRPNPNANSRGIRMKAPFEYAYSIVGDRRLELIAFQNPLSDKERKLSQENNAPVWTKLLPQYAPGIAIPLVVAAHARYERGSDTRSTCPEEPFVGRRNLNQFGLE